MSNIRKCSEAARKCCQYKELCGEDAVFTEGSKCAALNDAVDGAGKKLLTRGDRIRAMSDAELAGLFFQFRFDAYGRSQGAEVVLPDSMESIKKWLGDPVLGCEKEVFSLGYGSKTGYRNP